MVVFDTTTLLVALVPPGTVRVSVAGQDIPDAHIRVDYLISTLDRRTKVVIPTPALAEALVGAGDEVAQQYVERIDKSAVFVIADFDLLAALEAAAMTRDALAKGRVKVPNRGTYQKIKVDRQIVAIAKQRGCSVIYSNDTDIKNIAGAVGISLIGVENLPLPPSPPQPSFL